MEGNEWITAFLQVPRSMGKGLWVLFIGGAFRWKEREITSQIYSRIMF
jgi:hypothetical protein